MAPLAFLLASRGRAVNLVRYGGHLSTMLLNLARELVPATETVAAGAHSASAVSAWGPELDVDGESPYRD